MDAANSLIVGKYNLLHNLLVLITRLFDSDTKRHFSQITYLAEIGKYRIYYFDNINHIIVDKGLDTIYSRSTKKEE